MHEKYIENQYKEMDKILDLTKNIHTHTGTKQQKKRKERESASPVSAVNLKKKIESSHSCTRP